LERKNQILLEENRQFGVIVFELKAEKSDFVKKIEEQRKYIEVISR
jgi:hypothetical protein